MPLSTSRMLIRRGLPPALPGGTSGSKMAHSRSVKSLAYLSLFIPPFYPSLAFSDILLTGDCEESSTRTECLDKSDGSTVTASLICGWRADRALRWIFHETGPALKLLRLERNSPRSCVEGLTK